MGASGPGMFSSDKQFLAGASAFMIGLGLLGLLFVLLCRLFGLGLCDLNWVPIFGGFDVFRADLAAINLPLAMLIMGIGLRLYTPFGWFTCLALLLLLGGGFSLLAWRLQGELPLYWQQVAEQPLVAQGHPVMESIVVNIAFASLALVMFVYLLLPGPRSLFWANKHAAGTDAS